MILDRPAGNVQGEYQQEVQQALKGMGVYDKSALGQYVQYIHEKVSAAPRIGGSKWVLLPIAIVVLAGAWW